MKLKTQKWLDLYFGHSLLWLLWIPVRALGLALKKKHHFSELREITFIKIIGGGSLFIALPLFVSLKNTYPRTRLRLLCSRQILGFAEALGVFDEILVVQDRGLAELVRSGLTAWIKILNFRAVVVDLEIHSRLTTALSVLTCAFSRLGLVNQNSIWRKRLYTHAVFVHPGSNISEAYDGLAALLGVTQISQPEARKFWKRQISSVALDSELLSSLCSEKYLAFGTGCSALSPERQMSPKLWHELLDFFLSKTSLSIIFLGGSEDFDFCESLMATRTADTRRRIKNLCGGLKLSQSLRVQSLARGFIGIDSALLHGARWSEIPVLGFWGPTHPQSLLRRFSSEEQSSEIHLYKALNCSPCVHIFDRAPCGGVNICMNHNFKQHLQEFLSILSRPKSSLSSKKLHENQCLVFFPDERPQFVPFKVELWAPS